MPDSNFDSLPERALIDSLFTTSSVAWQKPIAADPQQLIAAGNALERFEAVVRAARLWRREPSEEAAERLRGAIDESWSRIHERQTLEEFRDELGERRRRRAEHLKPPA